VLFNSYVFLLGFLPITAVGYYALAHFGGSGLARLWLATSSFVFYGWWNPLFVVLLLGSIAVNYTLSLWILNTAERPEQRGWLLTGGIVLNLGVLVYYKYLFVLLGFFHGIGWLSADFGQVVLPLGISFFTFTQIGYLVDCQQEQVRERGLVNYVLFVTFFPHLIAGPILHHREIMPQFAAEATYRLNPRYVAAGLTVFVLGLAKKVLLADTIAPWAEAGFAHSTELGVLGAWSTVLAYSMQLYFDFSGYSDMAIGLGAMFGVRLPLNFNSPYKSRSVIDFWQRWHMTLTRYLTLLIYNPISLRMTRGRMLRGLPANRRAAESFGGFVELIAFPTFVTILLAGVWHGAGMQFVIFGLLHSLYLIVNHAWRIFGPRSVDASGRSLVSGLDRVWRVVLTYACVLLAQVFFRADSVRDAMGLLGGAFGHNGVELPLVVRGGRMVELGSLGRFFFNLGLIAPGEGALYDATTKPLMVNSLLIVALGAIAFGTPNVYQILGEWSPALQKVPAARWRAILWQPNLAWSVGCGVMLFYAMTKLDHPGRFLYFQF
jgi:D-alanyl-lipoteichoic acid acyltransferase DltB (MBOAT superfamily)